MSYIDQFTPWYQGVDISTDGVTDPFSVLEDSLYPYKLGGNIHPLDHRAMKEREQVTEAAILKCMKH